MLTTIVLDEETNSEPKKTYPKSRVKKALNITPLRLTTKDACFYMSMGETKFKDEAAKQGLTVSVIGAQHYYKISELDQWFTDKEINKMV